ARDLITFLWHSEAGLELGWPRLFSRGGLAVGYQHEFGWWGLRMAYAQVSVLALERLQLLGRLSLTEDTPASGTGNFASRELGGYLAADWLLSPYFKIRFSGL